MLAKLLPWIDALLLPACPACETRLEPGASSPLCSRCQAAWPAPLRLPLRLRGVAPVWSAWPYQGSLRDLLVQVKEEPRHPGLEILVDGVVELWRQAGKDADQSGGVNGLPPLLAVPPSRRRRRRRWHLAGVMARALVEHGALAAPLRLRRAAQRPPQASLDGPARRGNLVGSFRATVIGGARAPPRVWVVDDVMTTGATLRESARALREAGVPRVGALTLARVVL